jgi:hypothetical protein
VSFASAIKGRTDVEQPHEVHQTALKQVIRALRYSAGISGALLTTRLGEPLTIGQFLIPATPRVAQGAPPFPRCSDEFNAMPDMQSRSPLSSLPSDGVRQCHSATSVGPAERSSQRIAESCVSINIMVKIMKCRNCRFSVIKKARINVNQRLCSRRPLTPTKPFKRGRPPAPEATITFL